MIVTLLRQDGMNSISLPEKIKGQYWITYYTPEGEQKPLMGIEAIDNRWIAKSNKKVKLIGNEGQIIRERQLEPYNLYMVQIEGSVANDYLFVEPVTLDRKQYKKFLVTPVNEISIGRDQRNLICFKNITASSSHATLIRYGKEWAIRDDNSTNGTYLNNSRIDKETKLIPGDVIYIMGLKIIIGNGFLAFNNPDNLVELAPGIFREFEREQMAHRDAEEYEDAEQEYFYRSPRFKRDVETKTFKIDPPPSDQSRDEIPLMMSIGPSMTMGLASLTTGLFAVNNAIQNGNVGSAVPSIVMSLSMLLGTVMWPILTKRYEKKKSIELESKRQFKYNRYLGEIAADVEKELAKQKEIIEENTLTISQCDKIICNVKRELWEREPGQNDFLKLRIGIGDIPADIKYTYQERKFVLEDDNLQNQMLEFCENPKKLEGAPLSVSFYENYFSGVVGNRMDTIAFAKGLLLQMLTYYSYDEFKIVLLIDSKELKEFETIRWIPHVWDDEKRVRLIATNQQELKDVSAYMEQVISQRAGLHDEERVLTLPYYMIFAFDRGLANKADMLKYLYRQRANMNISVITFCDAIKDLPKECTTVMELLGGSSRMFNKRDMTGERITFSPDIYVKNNMEQWNMQLANLQLDILATAYNLPKMMTFLEMYGVGKIEHLNALARWKENDPTVSLEVPIGVDTFGGLFMLDLHEKYHGPHGLVAGMTGSGKSEFIMTYILSLALNFHPNEVAFILIDYKGGGMAKAFENLPHTAGIITNLDGAAVNRSLVSIQSELKRRQAIFVEAGNKVGESNVDIYKYQKLYRQKVVTEPLQHLFIISDEFAELKTQQPEFMEQLISAARIGRSLGVHLILATQKPAGVVDDQIWSNSKFKICLKVQDRADSMDMLKRPDAAELSDTGRFYLQVGYNELFELGQSAWAGAPYYPSDQVQVEKDDTVEVFDNTGKVIKQIKPKKRSLIRNPQKQLDAITDYLRQTADTEGIIVRPLWLEPVPEYIYVDDLERKYNITEDAWTLNPVIGEYDDPARQRQSILRLPITDNGNAVVYGAAGLGKTTFLIVMMYSLMKHHSPDELNLYIMDFSSESLKVFEAAPHVGDVIVSGDDERITNLFKLLHNELQDRKQLFASYGGDMRSYIRESGKAVANIVVAINGFASFMEQYDMHEEDIIFLTREGTKYGIYFVVAAVNTNDVRYKILQNFNQHFTLQLNDVTDYATVLGNVGGLYPGKYKGRGLFRNDEVYEFQTAYISEKGENVIGAIREFCKWLKDTYGEGNIKKIPVLPDKLDVSDLEGLLTDRNRVPIGIGKDNLEYQYLDMASNTITLIMGLDMDEILPFAKGLVKLVGKLEDSRVVVLDPNRRLDVGSNVEYKTSNMEECIDELFELLLYRNNTYKDNNGVLPDDVVYDSVIYIMQNYNDIYDELSDENKEALRALLEKNDVAYNLHIIIIEEQPSMHIRAAEMWFKKHCGLGNGVWVGNGIADQYTMKVSSVDRALRKGVDDDFGYVLNNGVPCLTMLVEQEDTDW